MPLSDSETALSVNPSVVAFAAGDITGDRRGDGSYDVCFTGDKRPNVISRPRDVLRHRRASDKAAPLDLATPEYRATVRSFWRSAQEASESIVQAAVADDQMGLAIAVDDLDKRLADLWSIRHGRDINWVTILNHLQGVMRLAFLEKRVEKLTIAQCRSIARLVKDYLGPATKTTDDLNEVLRIFDESGFDPYAAISADPLEAEKTAAY